MHISLKKSSVEKNRLSVLFSRGNVQKWNKMKQNEIVGNAPYAIALYGHVYSDVQLLIKIYGRG